MGRVVANTVGLAGPIAIDEVRSDKIRKGDTRRVANSERRIAQGSTNRSPHINDLEAVVEQLFGLIAH
jgi:hypothetical protein